jgi:nicotinate-nucleotide adenylyltransferase
MVQRRRIGLLGGSFNPPHAGHVHLSRVARRMLKLDTVWWLISLGNPLKPNPPPPVAARLRMAADITRNDLHIIPTDLEERLGTRYTIDTVCALQRQFPETDFVWICGSDIASEIHRWKNWQTLIKAIPFICVARGASAVRGNTIRMMQSEYQHVLSQPTYADLSQARWYWVMTGARHTASSTALRRSH